MTTLLDLHMSAVCRDAYEHWIVADATRSIEASLTFSMLESRYTSTIGLAGTPRMSRALDDCTCRNRPPTLTVIWRCEIEGGAQRPNPIDPAPTLLIGASIKTMQPAYMASCQ